jgi:hypothetical protein
MWLVSIRIGSAMTRLGISSRQWICRLWRLCSDTAGWDTVRLYAQPDEAALERAGAALEKS